jgi:DNA-binding winged helix-turn-helix (wHTH) protein
MSRPTARRELALEPDFRLGPLDVRPSACRVINGDAEVRVEALTMSALVVLARAAGATVTREELVATCWQGRFVSDDAIARTISKIRMLARGMEPQPFILENVPKVGYRLVAVDEGKGTGHSPPPPGAVERPRRLWQAGALVAGLMLVAFMLGSGFSRQMEPAYSKAPAGTRSEEASTSALTSDVMDAILSLNADRLTQYLQQGWKADWFLDTQENTALTFLPSVCERDPFHDQAGLLKVATLLVATGANPAHRNKWNDNAYIISREGRYCGPDHPVTAYLRSITPGAQADPVDKQLGARTSFRQRRP